MRKQDLTKLEKPYVNPPMDIFDNRFESAIGADVPNANKLIQEIFNDLDKVDFGIRWWNLMPPEERILISDYLYQCAYGIKTNLTEAKLHFLEWLHSREKNNDAISNLIINQKPASSPVEELYQKLEELHICGFLRAIGSSLDCLGSLIVGVLGLPMRKNRNLRKCDIKIAEESLDAVIDNGNTETKLQIEFRDFFKNVKSSVGPNDWLEWTDLYRNMYVHRGRRTIFFKVNQREPKLFDGQGNLIQRFESSAHLPKYPDRTDVEAFIKGMDISLFEDAEITLSGIFKSSRELLEIVCEKLLEIWNVRRNSPTIIDQPQTHWDNKIKKCNFTGYETKQPTEAQEVALVNPVLGHRMLSAAVLDHQRKFWENSKWRQ